MPSQKRKRPHDDLTDSTTAQPPKPQEPVRRVTRQNPRGLLDEEKHQLRSGRVRANPVDETASAKPAAERTRVKKNDAPKTVAAPPAGIPMKQTRHSKQTRVSTELSKENIRPSTQNQIDTTTTPTPLKTVLPSHSIPPQPTNPPKPSRAQPRAPPSKPSPQQQKSLKSIPTSSAAAVATAAATALATPKRALGEKPLKPPPTPRSDRNIDKIVLGNICFKAWYPSYYGKEVLGDVSGNAGGGKDIGGARMGGGKRDPPMLDRLYVCPCCFKYSKELVSWWEHVRCCERKGVVPGRKVYTHPKGARVRKVRSTAAVAEPATSGVRGKGKKKVDVEPPVIEQKIDEDGEWSIWEVDGEDERLFCQNLSLFAKLFLDNKSVFFDVSGFNYFLLVYTPPPHSSTSLSNPPSQPGPPPSLAAPSQQDAAQTHPPSLMNVNQQDSPNNHSPPHRPQIVGFFSKEKMSWDNNNLACILVFPPWQRKGLGSILMGVSYEISRREGILGGPEKPISELGRKGYKRFWAGEIARWLLGLETSSLSSSTSALVLDGEGEDEEKVVDDGETAEIKEDARSLLVDIQMCSRATWIVPEDCLLVLREMGVVKEADPGTTSLRDVAVAAAAAPVPTTTAVTAGDTAAAGAAEEDADEKRAAAAAAAKEVKRVRVDKAAVRRWVAANKIGLERTCDPDGFLEGYAIKKAETDDDNGGE